MKTALARKLPDIPALKTEGIALEYFPGYKKQEKRLHSVDVVLLSFIIRGKGIHYLGTEAFPEQGPSLSITHYGQVHDINTDAKGMDIMNLYLNLDRFRLPEMPVDLREVLPQILPLHPNFYRTPGHMTRIAFPPDSPTVGLVKAMHREFTGRDPGRFEVLRDYFRIFLVECCRQVIRSGVQIMGRGRPFVHEVMEPLRQFVDAHYTEYLSLESLAKKAGYSAPYLCRLFKEYTGKRIYDYILDKRLQSAMLELKTTDRRISAITSDSGFGDLSFFNKLFRRKLGVSPREYRKAALNRSEKHAGSAPSPRLSA